MNWNRAGEYALLGGLFALSLVNGGVAYLHSVRLAGAPGTAFQYRSVIIQSNIWTKVAVEGFLLVVLGIAVVVVLARGTLSLPRPRFLYPLLAVVVMSLLWMALRAPFIALAGFRAFLPMAFLLIAYNFMNRRTIYRLAGVLLVLIVVSVALGVLQILSNSGDVRGTYGVYSIFNFPGAFALFLVGSLTVVLPLRFPRTVKWAVIGIATLGVTLTKSGTGILGLLLVAGLYLYRRSEEDTVLAAMALSSPLLLLSLPLLTGRANIFFSAATRVEILVSRAIEMGPVELLIGTGLGSGSNLAVSLTRFGLIPDGELVFIADSLYLSLLSQIGALGLTLFVLFNLSLLAGAWNRSDPASRVLSYLIPLVLLAGVSKVLLEMFPLIWIYWIVIGLYLLERSDSEPGPTNNEQGPTDVGQAA